jgi:sarcosine oxidase subunit alpha
MQPQRLPTGGRIDRSKPLSFRFDGRKLEGYAGDTLASALLANGVSIVGRSFKLRRPRGIVGSGAEEPNAIMQIGKGAHAQPNLRATQVELYEGLVARTTKGWPGARFDLGAINDIFGKVFSAGFYYKTFMRPKSWWHLYERFIRASAGFGRAPTETDPDHYEHRNAHCDVLIAGGGPAGLSAALAAGRAGARVILADEQDEFGGSLAGAKRNIGDAPADEWLRRTVESLAALDNVTLLPRSTVFGYYDHNFLAIAERCTDHLPEADRAGVRQRLWRVRAKQVVLAQGAFERPLAFCNNDRPGVMLASAVSQYIRRYAVRPGRRAVVFTNNDSAYETAIDLAEAGSSVVIVDSRADGAGSLGERAAKAGISVIAGHIVTDVVGRRRVRGVRVAGWSGNPSYLVESSIHIDCDLVAVSGGWSPAVHLHSHAGGRNAWDTERHCFVPGEAAQANVSAGACNGKWSLRECLREGIESGRAAASRCGFEAPEIDTPSTSEGHYNPLQPLWRVPADAEPERCPKQFLDFQNDTSVADIRLAVREGYRNVEHVKRYTALGFGTDQGKLGNIIGMAVLAECLGKSIPEVGAPMENVGQWHRPWYFPRDGEDLHAAVARECVAARQSLGIMDASTLGKIDARGRDVVEFLERIYTHNVGKMKIGRCAYGIMLGEDGMVMDDGVMARLGEQRFYLTTTTGGAANVLAWLEAWLQTEWPELEVFLTSLTDHFSTIAMVGPNSRRVLERIGCTIDLDKDSFPFMAVRDAELGGYPVQLFRVSFSGELAFEINIDSGSALEMWKTVMAAGEEFGVTPYGTETMHVLRAEKGFVIVGQDTDGSVTPVDLGMNWLLSKDKDFLGKRSLARPDCLRSDRKQLVGLLSSDNTVLPEGTQLVEAPGAPVPVPMCGHVTSSYMSACLGHPIALALVAGGRARKGETIYAALPGREPLPVTIAAPVFYDPKGERQHV